MNTSKELPGITFQLDEAEEYEVAGKKRAAMRITASYDDDDQFMKVKQKFMDGFRIYTMEDFKGTMLKVLREDVTAAERRIKELEMEVQSLKGQLNAPRTTPGTRVGIFAKK